MILFLNWLVQGSVLTLIVAGGVRVCRTMSAATREVVWWVTVSGVLAMPVVSVLTTAEAAGVPFASAPIPSSLLIQVSEETTWWLPSLVAAWIAWVAVWLSRIGAAIVRLRWAKQQATPLAARRERRLPTWTALGGRGRPAHLVVSEQVRNAAVLGLGRPLIALAPESLEQLTDEELDYVVLHEYAHVQRRDDVAVLAQRLVWAIAGIHPAIWWLDRALTIEREVACDDWVVARLGSARGYAACLVKLSVGAGADGWSLAPRAGLSRGFVTIRVTRLLDPRRNTTTRPSIRVLLAVVPATVGLAAACLAATLVELEPGPWLPTPRPAATSATTQSAGQPARRGFVFHAPVPPQVRRSRISVSASALAERTHPVESAVSEMLDVSTPSPASATHPPDVLPATRIQTPAIVAPVSGREHGNEGSATRARRPTDHRGMTPWRAAANVGVVVGTSSHDAAIRTAGFFSRAGKSIGGAF